MMYVFDTGVISLADNYLTWKIYNFFTLPLSVGWEIRSKQFTYKNSRYNLYIWPRGQKGSGTEEWFGICLYKYDAPGFGDSVQFSIATTFGNIKTCTVKCSENNLFRQERFMEWSDFLTLSRKIAPDGCLTIICRLFVDNGPTNYEERDNHSKTIMQPIYESLIQYQATDYHSQCSLPLSSSSSLRINSTGAQVSSLEASGFNFCSPATDNFFCNSSPLEDSFEFLHESHEVKNSDLKMPYDAAGARENNSLRNTFRRSLNIAYVKKKSELTTNPAKNIIPKITSKSVYDSGSVLSNAVFSPEGKSDSEVASLATSVASASPGSTSTGVTLTSEGHSLQGLKVLSQQFKKLYLEGKNFDLTIIMEDKEFKVLKALLMTRSPVFAEMLSENASQTNHVITIDAFGSCNSAVFHDFLLYIYSGEIENLSDRNIHGLYCAACKFEMPQLKEECIRYLQTSLSIDTITGVFRSANNDSGLLDVAIIFLAKNMEVIMHTDEWKQFMREEPDRAIEYHLKALKIGYKKTIV